MMGDYPCIPVCTRSKLRELMIMGLLRRLGLAALLCLSPDLAEAQSSPDLPGVNLSDLNLSDLSLSGFSELPKEDKVLYLNLGVGTTVLLWGVWNWEWGTGGPRFQDEGWLGRGTVNGGADKLGHMYSGYVLSHLFAGQYERWDYTNDVAARLGALSSVGVMSLIEIGDAFSDEYGFSYQDMVFNIAGATLGYVLWRNPDLARKIDYRVEYNPFIEGEYQSDISTDYDRLKYLVAIKADGFDFIENPYLKYLELHLGFYARNYSEYSRVKGAYDPREQHVYVGLGLNIGKLLKPWLDTPIFNYIQVPYTYVPVGTRVD
jgi:uncharacterized protein YfiM (DUF2279 family)